MSSPLAEKRDTIVLGASAGGIEALQRLLPALGRVEASVFVVLHIPADGNSALSTVLRRSTPLEIEFARDQEAILPRRVYIAPADRHLIIEADRIRLSRGPRENRSRPAIDPLFRSAAVARRGRVMGAILSGLLDDGAAGLLAVKRCGGLAFIQSPEDALEPEMPERARAASSAGLDGSLTAGQLGARLAELTGSPAPAETAPVPVDIKLELDMLLGRGGSAIDVMSSHGPPLPLSCPECGGPLWSIRDGRLQRFRCHTGHSYGPESLLSGQAREIEQALWSAIKGLEQRSHMLLALATDERTGRRPASAESFKDEAHRLTRHAQTLRDVLVASIHETVQRASTEGE
jgi:two-component system chemotaxis response regulator CheB